MRVWTNALFEGILIAGPFILAAAPTVRKRYAMKGWKLVLAVAILLLILFSPFSFVGTKLDHVMFALLASTVVASGLVRLVPTERMIIPSLVLGLVIMAVYIPGKALFASRPVDVRAQDGLVYTLSEVPDMVMASQYTMQVDRRWLILEQRLWRSNVRPYCNDFTYDMNREELIATDTCQANISLPH